MLVGPYTHCTGNPGPRLCDQVCAHVLYVVGKIKEVVVKFFRYITHLVRWLLGFERSLSDILATIPSTPYRGLKANLNPNKLREAPPRIDMDRLHRLSEGNSPILARHILDCFDHFFHAASNETVLFDDLGTPVTKSEARNLLQTGYLHYIATRGIEYGSTEYNRRIAKNLDALLKGIVEAFQNVDVPFAKKEELFKELICSGGHCPPRRYEEATKMYLALTSPMDVQQELRVYIQNMKEDFLRNFYCLSKEPVMTIDYIRRLIGKECGLDVDPLKLEDQYIHMHDARFPLRDSSGAIRYHIENEKRVPISQRHKWREDFIETLGKVYQPEEIFTYMKARLNTRLAEPQFQTLVGAEIDKRIRQYVEQGILSPADAGTLPMPYMQNYTQLTDEGVQFLLVEFGFLVPEVPQSHLIRAAARPPMAAAG